jgi:hypothetical protein
MRAKPKKKPKKAFGFDSEKDLFMYLWDNSDHKCRVSGKTLDMFFGTTRFWSMFAHILPKGRYPEYRLNPDNVWIVHPDIHDLFDNRSREMQDASGYDFNPLRQKKEQLKADYYENYS